MLLKVANFILSQKKFFFSRQKIAAKCKLVASMLSMCLDGQLFVDKFWRQLFCPTTAVNIVNGMTRLGDFRQFAHWAIVSVGQFFKF
jgi:hypothetical protein